MANRDEFEDFKQAYLAEFKSYLAAGLNDRAAAVAEVLDDEFGVQVDVPVVERAVPGPLETAVEKPVRKQRSKPQGSADESEVDTAEA